MALPDDIRHAAADGYWSAFTASWTSLLTYRYLGRTNPVLDRGIETVSMPLRHDMRNAGGGVLAAPLCIAAAESGGMHDNTHVPSPVTATLQIIDDARGVSRVKVLPETLRIGRTMGFSRSLIVDADAPERVIALSSGTAVSLGKPPAGYERVDNPPLAVADSIDMPRLHEVFGVRRLQAGVWELPPLDVQTASPDAALHLGPQHIAMETAAMELACLASANAVPQILCWQVMFLARGKCGPFRTHASLQRGRAGSLSVRVDLLDTGNNDLLITAASASFALCEGMAGRGSTVVI